jgi:membrane-associated PAP2 superfamily phosphatase
MILKILAAAGVSLFFTVLVFFLFRKKVPKINRIVWIVAFLIGTVSAYVAPSLVLDGSQNHIKRD